MNSAALITADPLISELTGKVGLGTVDAHRAAFTALACRRGWSKARIGRYLGISRARVAQKVEKLEHYAITRTDLPVLEQVMSEAGRAQKIRDTPIVAFETGDWDDEGFARELIDQLAT